MIYHSNNYPTLQFAPQFEGISFNDFTFLNQSGNIYGRAVGYSFLGARTIDTAGHTWMQNELNPFQSTTSLKYTLQQPGNVRLALGKLQGEMVSLLLNEYQTTGEHSVMFD